MLIALLCAREIYKQSELRVLDDLYRLAETLMKDIPDSPASRRTHHSFLFVMVYASPWDATTVVRLHDTSHDLSNNLSNPLNSAPSLASLHVDYH